MELEEIVIFSPLPPSRTGIADYMVELGMEVEKFVRVFYVIDNAASTTNYEPNNGTIITVKDFESQERLHGLPLVYQLGNNTQHEYILRMLQERPGIVVMHDFSIHHLLVELTLARGDLQTYEDLMTINYGDLGTDIARRRSEGYFNELLQFVMPLNKTVIEASQAIVVHSYDSYYKIKDISPDMPVGKIPFPFQIQKNIKVFQSKDEARDAMGIKHNSLILASFGFVTPPKQIEFILKSLSSLKNKFDDFEYWIVGEISDAVPVRQCICEYDLEEHVKLFGFVGLDELHHYMQICDIALSLRYPSAGETSAALFRTMGLGTCCVVFDYASYADIDDDAVVKISLDTFDTHELTNKLLELANDQQKVTDIGNKAKNMIQMEHKASISAKEFVKFIKKVRCAEQKGEVR